MLFYYQKSQGSPSIQILNIYIRSSWQKFESSFILIA